MNISTSRLPSPTGIHAQARQTKAAAEADDEGGSSLTLADRIEIGATSAVIGSLPFLGVYPHAANSFYQPSVPRAMLVGYGGSALNLAGSITLFAGLAAGNLQATHIGAGLLGASGLAAALTTRG